MDSNSKLDRIERNIEILKIRQIEAKRRRDMRLEASRHHKILNLEKWSLIRYMRSQSLGKKYL